MKTVQISQQINPHFYELWTTDKPYIVAKGGRGSFKSSVISLKLATMMMEQIAKGHTVNVVCIRENANNLRDSVYNQIMWALGVLGIQDEFRARVSPLTITHKRSGSSFYFYGADKPEKLKSNIVSNIIGVWFEEFANFKNIDAFDTSVPTFIRQKPDFVNDVKIFCSYNPPRNPYTWVNEWIKDKENDPDFLVDHSTYLDDELGFTTQQQLKLIEKYKRNDEDYYKWLYLGEVIGLGTNVYDISQFKLVDKIPDDEAITNIFYGMDNGNSESATTCVACGLTNKYNLYLLDTYYYSPHGKRNKKPPYELVQDVHNFIDDLTNQYGLYPSDIVMDSAEGAFYNQYYSMYNIFWTKVRKIRKPDMIDRVQDLLAQGRFYVLDKDENNIFMSEHKKYEWDENTLHSDNPEVIKVDDHTCDAFMYLILTEQQYLGLSY